MHFLASERKLVDKPVIFSSGLIVGLSALAMHLFYQAATIPCVVFRARLIKDQFQKSYSLWALIRAFWTLWGLAYDPFHLLNLLIQVT